MSFTRNSAELAEKAATRAITLLLGVYALALFAQAAGVIHIA
jgi:hypothetical protein